MNDKSRAFESKIAFRALMSIIISLVLLSAANCYAEYNKEISTAGSGETADLQETYDKDVNSVGYKYEVIAEKGVVNVYSIDPLGEKAFFCETDIPYQLLSENDKKLMKKGIVLNTMEELSNLLQDFES